VDRKIVNLEQIDSVLITIFEQAKKLIHSDFQGLAIREDSLTEPVFRFYATESGIHAPETLQVITNPLILKTLTNAKTYLSTGEESMEALQGLTREITDPIGSFVFLPLVLDNNPIGVLWTVSFTPQKYSEVDATRMQTLADQIVMAIQLRMLPKAICCLKTRNKPNTALTLQSSQHVIRNVVITCDLI